MQLYLGHVAVWTIIFILYFMFIFAVALCQKRGLNGPSYLSLLVSAFVAALFSWMAHKFLFGG